MKSSTLRNKGYIALQNREKLHIDTEESDKFLLASYNTGLKRKASFLDRDDRL